MLKITVPGVEHYNEEKKEFFYDGDCELELEHSLVTVSKWEQIHKIPFLSKQEKTQEEILSYVKCMIITEDFPPEVLTRLSRNNYEEINEFLNDPMTATWFNESAPPRTTEIITNELIYYWMFSFGIDIECQHWHFNRLLTLIKVMNLKNAKPKPMSKAEAAERQRRLNAERRKQYGTSG